MEVSQFKGHFACIWVFSLPDTSTWCRRWCTLDAPSNPSRSPRSHCRHQNNSWCAKSLPRIWECCTKVQTGQSWERTNEPDQKCKWIEPSMGDKLPRNAQCWRRGWDKRYPFGLSFQLRKKTTFIFILFYSV